MEEPLPRLHACGSKTSVNEHYLHSNLSEFTEKHDHVS